MRLEKRFESLSRQKNFLTIEQARKKKLKLDWANYTPKTLILLEQLLKLIWMFWFPISIGHRFLNLAAVWQISSYFEDEVVGEQATSVLRMHKKC
jgi:5-methyltetrahydrofolate--homocysteine methyltransferase